MIARYFRPASLAVFVAVALLTLSSAVGEVLAKPAVIGVRAGDHGQKTRFVLDLSESVQFRVFTLADPYRVVIDFPEMDWSASEKGLTRPVGLIKGYRHGLFRSGNSRIVLDLAEPVGVKSSFILPPRDGAGWRFVLDLAPVTRAAFMATQGAPPETAETQPAAPPAIVPAALPLAPEPERKRPPAKPTIVIDPGHGGVDPGAIGISGVYEKQLTLAMARQLAAELEARGTYKVILTRDRDIFLSLRQRVAIARTAGADLFVSLHADTVQDRRIRGLSVYTLSEKASDAEAAQLADKENKADLIAGMDLSHESPEVTSILIDLAQRETMNLSAAFASGVVDELGRETKLLRNTHRFAGFAVLKAPDVPSILLEMGYLSNSHEERLLRDSSYRAKLAKAMARAIDRYFLNIQKAQRP